MKALHVALLAAACTTGACVSDLILGPETGATGPGGAAASTSTGSGGSGTSATSTTTTTTSSSGGGGGAGGACPDPQTCLSLHAQCGTIDDGCGHVINCGSCSNGNVCGAPAPNVCGMPQCTPRTCVELGFDCGTTGDGCGNILQCGTCEAGETCSGNVCAAPTDAGTDA